MPVTIHQGTLPISATLTASGTAIIDYKKEEIFSGGSWVAHYSGSSDATVNFGGQGFQASTYRDTTAASFGVPATYTYGVLIEGTGAGYPTYKFPLFFYSGSDTHSLSYRATLTWEIETPAELFAEWTQITTTGEGMGTSQPLYQNNGYYAVFWQHSDTYTLSVTIDLAPVSGSDTWTDSQTVGIGSAVETRVHAETNATSRFDTASGTPDTTIQAIVTWASSTAFLSDSRTYTQTVYPFGDPSLTLQGTIEQEYTSDSHTITAIASNAAAGTLVTVTGESFVKPQKTADLILDVFGLTGPLMEGASTADPTVQINGTDYTATDGHLAQSVTLIEEYVKGIRRPTIWFLGYEYEYWIDEVGSTAIYDTVEVKIATSWMDTTRGYLSTGTGIDSSYGSYFHLKDRRYDSALQIDLADEYAMSAGTDSGVTGGTRRTWSDKQSLTPYRYLSVETSADLDAPSTIKIVRDSGASVGQTVSYEWEMDRDGLPIMGSGPFVIDLLCPTNRGVNIDATPTTYPEDVSGSLGIRRGEGWLTGPSWVDRLEVIGESGGSAPTIGDVKLVRHATAPKALLTCLDQQGAWADIDLPGHGGATFWKRPFLSLTTDGRVEAATETDSRCRTVSGVLTAASYKLSEMISALGESRNVGITATRLIAAESGSPPAWESGQLPAVGLGGAGWIWDAVGQEWECTIDTQLTDGTGLETITLDYQLGARKINFPADCGDIFGHANTGTTTGATTIVGYAMIHSQAVGVVLGDPGTPDDAVTIGVKVPSSMSAYIPYPDERGTGDSGDLGYYATGNDGMRGYIVSHTAYSNEYDTSIYAAPRRRFPVRIISLARQLLSMATSATQRVCRGTRSASGTLTLEYRTVGTPDTWTSSTTNLDIPRGGCLAYDRRSESQTLWIAYETTSGGIECRYTNNEGGAWSVADTITTAGRCPALAISPTQGRYFAWVDAGAVKVKGLDSIGNEITPETTVVASGVANNGLALEHDGETLFLTYRDTGGTITTIKSSDGGLTFA